MTDARAKRSRVAFIGVMLAAAVLVVSAAIRDRLEIGTALQFHDLVSGKTLEHWHDFLIAMLTLSATLVAAAIAVLGFSQRAEPRPNAPVAERVFIVSSVAFTLRATITTISLLLNGAAYSAIGLVPDLTPETFMLLGFLSLAGQLVLLAFFLLVSGDMREANRRTGLVFDPVEAQALRAERERLVEDALPHLGSRYAVKYLEDINHAFPDASGDEELSARIRAHNQRSEPFIAIVRAAMAAGLWGMPTLFALERGLPTRATLFAFLLSAAIAFSPAFVQTTTVIVAVSGLATFAALVFAAVSAMTFVRASMAWALSDPPDHSLKLPLFPDDPKRRSP